MSHAMTFGEPASSDDKLWGLLAHLTSFLVPFFGSLIVYLIHKDKPFIAYHAAQAMVVQFAVYIAASVIGVIAGVTCGIGAILYVCLIPAPLFPIYGAWKAYQGDWHGYPLIGGIGK